jgi:hypothetical protein
MQFREFYGMFMEHCHNTVHEDHAMLVRWELDRGLVPMPTPVPTPQGVGYIASTTLPTAFSQPSGGSAKTGSTTNGGGKGSNGGSGSGSSGKGSSGSSGSGKGSSGSGKGK